MRTDLVSVLFAKESDCREYHNPIADTAKDSMIDNLTYTEKEFNEEHFVRYSEKYNAWVSVTWFDDYGLSINDIMQQAIEWTDEVYNNSNKFVELKGVILGNIFEL